MRGRKRTPTELKRRHGNPGKRRLNESEPVPQGALDEAPAWMTRELKANWDYALANAPPGLLRKIDRAMLTVWVVAEDTHRRAAQLLDTTRTLLMRQDGEAKPFPSLYLGIMNKQALILAKVVAELGFSPCSRVRLFANTGPPSNSAPILNADSGDNVIPLRRYIQNAPPRPLRAG